MSGNLEDTPRIAQYTFCIAKRNLSGRSRIIKGLRKLYEIL